jgi:hypothetical protein
VLLQSLDNCQTGPPLVGDINWDGQVDLLDTVLSRRLLAGLPIEPPSPAVTSLKLRDANTDVFIESVENGDIWSLSDLGDCLAIDIGTDESTSSVRYDWTEPGQSEVVAYYWEQSPPYCWKGDAAWTFGHEVPNCTCDSGDEMRTPGVHTLRLTPCSENVDFGASETCVGNGGVEGTSTEVTFTIAP